MRILSHITTTLLLTLLCGQTAFAQNETAAGAALEATYKVKLPRSWTVALGPATEFRPFFSDGTGSTAGAPPTLRNLDLNVALVRRWLESWRFGSALRLRSRYPGSEEAAREVRTWLYAERVADLGYFRWSQRLRTEQRFRSKLGDPLALTYRHRYRLSVDRTLPARQKDAADWFATASFEVLVSTRGFAERPNNIDLRPIITFGRRNLAYGLEYRYARDLNRQTPSIEQAWLLLMLWSL